MLGYDVFQSTLPCRERHKFPGVPHKRHRVSIHAPVQGATLELLCHKLLLYCFNPRSCAGSDNNCSNVPNISTTFQSTLPCRERLLGTASSIGSSSSFNPRSRAGSDDKAFTVIATHGVSIHAPVQGATVPLKKAYPAWFSTLHSAKRLSSRPILPIKVNRKPLIPGISTIANLPGKPCALEVRAKLSRLPSFNHLIP